MSTAFTVIGDPHATNRSLDKIHTLFGIVESKRCPAIWLGDLLDTKEVIRGNCLNAYYSYFKNSSLKHYIIVGNHDWFNLECEDHSLKVLEALPNVTIIDSLTKISKDVYAVPYVHNKKLLKEMLANTPSSCSLFGHFEVTDFDFGNGRMCEDGMDFEFFSKFKLVVSGHFHKYQSKGNFVYLGTPFSHSFGETNQYKYLGHFTADGRLSTEELQFPRHWTIEIDCDKEVHGVNDFQPGKPGDYIRLILTGTEENINKMAEKFKDVDCKIIKRATDGFVQNVNIDETKDNVDQFQTWAKDIKQLNQDTIDLGIGILKDL